MDTARLYNTFIRYIWLLIVLAVLGGGVAWFISVKKTVPMYRADCTMYVYNRGGSWESYDLTLSRQMAQDYSEIIHSRRVNDATMSRLSYTGISENELSSALSVSKQENSIFFTVSGVWTDPETAALITNTVSSVMAETINELTNGQNASILDKAEVPMAPIPNNPYRKALAGVFIGLLVGICVVYLINLYDNTIRDPEEIDNELNLDVIGIIPRHSIK